MAITLSPVLSPRCIAFSLTFCTKCWFHKKQQARQQSHGPGHAERYCPVPRHVPGPPYNTQAKAYTSTPNICQISYTKQNYSSLFMLS